MSSTAGPTSNISAKKLALLKKLRKKEGHEATDLVTIMRRQDRESYPLSFAQQRLWFLDQMQPGMPIYNITIAWQLNGHLDVPALERSLRELLQRHEVLRSSFITVEGDPVQRIHTPSDHPLHYVDLRALASAQREQEVQRLMTCENAQPFDLSQGPLLRANLLCLKEHSHLFILCQHHIVSDAWSIDILHHELVTLYNAFVQGYPSPLPALPLQYADFASWQRDWLQGEVLQQQLTYWKQHLAGATTALQLPTDWPRPATQVFEGAVCKFLLPTPLHETLQALCYRENVTLFMLLLAVFNILLCRYSGQEDILLGTPIANRTHTEIEGLIGFFINTLVLRTDLSGNPTFRELLARVREVALAAYSHQDLPFERLVEAIQPARSLNRSPLFQVMFSLQNAGMPGEEFLALTTQDISVGQHVAKFDLSFNFQETSTGIEGQAEYATSLFTATTIERLVNHYQQLLHSIVNEPDQHIYDLSLLTNAELQQMLTVWNDNKRAYIRDMCLHQLFEAQVARTPDAIAVVCADHCLTYDVLNQRANQLAHQLRQLGIGPEKLVGICMQRSSEMPIALLGVLKAGGAYVPLDPAYPQSRLAFMLQDCQVSVLLTQQQFVEHLYKYTPHILCLDTDWPLIATQPSTNPNSQVCAENAAYVIYTSGSTGQPKGVLITHHAICNHMHWAQECLPLVATDRVLQKTLCSFDASVWEFYAPLLVGAQLVLARPDGHQDPHYLVEALDQYQITHLKLVPALLHLLLEMREFTRCTSLKRVLCGGEELSVSLQKLFFTQHQAELYNMYGPTEATIDATFWACEPEENKQKVSIGRPTANTQLYVLDTYLHPVPQGVIGELYIGGSGLARGYLNRPELIAERFLPDPFSVEPGARLYRTGDSVRYLPDGNIEFLGRLDQQVKLRGFRIELGEIEALLNQHPTIQQAVVVAHEDETGDKQLVAYVVAAEQAMEDEWRRYLRERLPTYMLPAIFVGLEALPLTPSGKVDRHALPAPALARPQVEYIAPRTALEVQIAQIWGQVLGLEQIGVQENFFELGGHSLKATQIISRVQQASGVMVPLRSLFEDPTIAGLARAIEHLPVPTHAIVYDRIQPISPEIRQEHLRTYLEDLPDEEREAVLTTGIMSDEHEQPFTTLFPVSFVQQRMWFLDQMVPDTTVYTIAEGIRLVGQLHRGALEQALDAIVARHETLRTVFPSIGGHPVQMVMPPSSLQVRFQDLSHVRAEERDEQVQYLLLEETQRPFSLATGPLLRSSLVRVAEEEHILVLSIHHIVFDNWSHGILIHELVQLYEAFATKQPSPLSPLPLQYTDYTRWQRDWLQGPAMHDQLTFWQQQLSGFLPHLDLPTDRPRPPIQTFVGADYPFTLPRATTKALTSLSHREGATLFMTLLAAFTIVLSRYSGQTDVLVGTPIANRTRMEVEGLIGCFINTLVLRTDLAGNPSLQEVLKRAQHMTLDAYAHQELPFEKIVEEVHPERDLSRSPLFQVMFVFQNAPQSSLTMRDLAIEFLPTPTDIAKFDLTLYLEETEQGIDGSFEYNTDIFEEATLARLAGSLHRVLQALVEQPHQLLSEVALLTAGERELILQQWNGTSSPYPETTCIHHLIEAQVVRTPDAVALIFEEHMLTYRALNERANQLAHYLQRWGVRSEVTVGIYMERSLDLIVGLMGILKAGGAYLPLDPEYPSERIAFMLADTQTPLIITTHALHVALPQSQAAVLCLEEEEEKIRVQPTSNVEGAAQADQLSYIIYTSGSTGRAKGVMIEHHNTVALLHWVHKTFTAQELARTLMATSICFDLSVFELFAPLSMGGTVILAENALYLLTLAKTHQATLINTVPSVMTELLRGDTLPSSVRVVNLAGEALPLRLVQQLYQVPSLEKVYNLYGPSEDTTYSTAALLARGGQVTIGYPIANSQAYVLDAHLEPVPIGVVGELYLGGAGLARGYYNRPALTAEKFIADPFCIKGGARLYRTGDLACYGGDGALEFLGRIDQQVKLRGFRIELGEIEAVLNQHPTIQQAVVVAHEDETGDKQLVAYVVAAEQETEDEWRRSLRERLPVYMIPAIFVGLEAFPLTPSGKVDRRALPVPALARSQVEYIAPRTALEVQIAQIWGQVLGLEQIGVQENFFELGGHSLKATQIISRIQQASGVMVPLRSLFEDPTIAGLARAIEQLPAPTHAIVYDRIQPISPEIRQEHLRTYLEDLPDEEREAVLTTGIVSDGHENPFTTLFPVSFVQQRMWFLDQMVPDTTVYTIPEGIRLVGQLHRDALEQALDAIVARHETLRTVFPSVGGRPVQMVMPPSSLQVRFHDLSHVRAEERDEQVQHLLLEETQRPFSLATGPLLRSSLVRVAEEEHILVLNIHHIAFDNWSHGILIHELVQLYEAFATKQPSPLSPLPLQYTDYTRWQRDWLQGPAMHDQLTFWQQQLSGPLPYLEMPTDRPRPAVQTFVGAEYPFMVPLPTAKALTNLSHQAGATLFMTLLAAFTIVLSRYSGQTDVLVGTPIANRTRMEVENLIGCFINTLVLRTDLAGNPSLQEVLKRVQQMTLDAYAHQDVPFEKIVEEVHPERDLSRSPLFQVMFVFQNTPQSSLTMRELTIEVLPTPTDIAKFDLTLYLEETEQGIDGGFVYNTDIFEEATLARLAGHLHRVLQALVEQPHQLLSEVALLTAGERELILQQWNDTSSAFPDTTCIHHLIEAQVARTPDAVALIFGPHMLTYRALNERANQLAHYLQRWGVGPEVLVGLCLERSLEMIVVLLAILKAGGAYVPLDPSYPPERLRFLLHDTALTLLLTSSKLVESLDILASLPFAPIVLERCMGQVLSLPASNPISHVSSEHLAYVIYTSGSTGQPKGAMLAHQGLCNLVYAQRHTYGLSEQSRILQFASLNFDASIFEILMAWGAGATLHLTSQDTLRSAAELTRQIQQEAITALTIPPSALTALLAEDHFPDLQTLVCAGEACPAELAAYWAGGRRMFNAYGPTETTVWASVERCTVAEAPGSVPFEGEWGRGGTLRAPWCQAASARVRGRTQGAAPTLVPSGSPGRMEIQAPSIGRPITNTQMYVLDASLQPVPIGVPGEIYIGGVGLSRGYLNRPELSAERFVPHPFSQQRGARLYKTGDMGRYLPSGVIMYLGRNDEQVKIRGFRIELGEIEAALNQHPTVQQAVVVAHEDEAGDKQLVAYVVAPEQETESAWRNYLRERLPAYMVPSIFLCLEALPLTPSGKIDRRALALSKLSAMRPQNTYVAPHDIIELQLVRIWEELLQMHPLGVTDNFFALGGHSLLVIRLMAYIQRTFGQELSLATFFQGATIEQQAHLLRQRQTIYSQLPLIPLQTRGAQPPLFLVHPIGGTVLCYLPLSQHLGTEQPVYGLQAPGINGERTPFTSIGAMATYYIAALREIQPHGPYMLGGWSMGGVVAFEIAQQLLHQDERVALLALFDSYAPQETSYAEENATSATVQFALDLGNLFGKQLSLTYEALQPLTSEEQITYIVDLLQQENAIPSDMGVQQVQHLLHVFKANLRAVGQYQMQPYPGSVTLFRAADHSDDDQISLGWDSYAAQGVITHTIPGNHYTMLQEAAVPTIAAILTSLQISQEDGR